MTILSAHFPKKNQQKYPLFSRRYEKGLRKPTGPHSPLSVNIKIVLLAVVPTGQWIRQSPNRRRVAIHFKLDDIGKSRPEIHEDPVAQRGDQKRCDAINPQSEPVLKLYAEQRIVNLL